VSALSKIQNRKYDVETFIDLAVEIEGGKLIEGKRFREWIVKYITQSSDALLEAKHLKTVIQDGGHRAWAICSLMVSALSYQNVDSVTREVKEVKVERSERSTLLSPPLSITKRYYIPYHLESCSLIGAGKRRRLQQSLLQCLVQHTRKPLRRRQALILEFRLG
jgi:hypothetical protein